MKKIVRISITTVLLLTLVPVVVYGIYLLWDQGVVPGNPRALSPDAMLEAVTDQVRYSSISEKDLCISPDPANLRPDRHGLDGFTGAPYPELYAQAFLLEKKDHYDRSRVPLFKRRNFFASHGFYRERERILDTDQGPRPAREYQLTWRGYVAQSQAKLHCFRVGRRGIDTIEAYEKLPQKIAENDSWKITYKTKLKDIPDWVNDPRARSLFPDLASMIQPTIDSVVVVRGADGWIPAYVARLQAAIRDADSEGSQESRDTSFLLQMAQAPRITQTEVDDALSNYLSSSAWDTKDRACFNPRIARGGDDHALAKQLSRTKFPSLEAIYYDVDTKHRGQYGYQRLAGQLYIWHALEKSGLARLEPIPPGEYRLRGKEPRIKTKGGVKYTLNRDAYAALQAAGRGLCIPVGRTHIGLVAVQPFAPGRRRILARGTVANPPDLAKKIAKSLPALDHVINKGFPITGVLQTRVSRRSQHTESQRVRKWHVNSLTLHMPEIQAFEIPASLQPLMTKTIRTWPKIEAPSDADLALSTNRNKEPLPPVSKRQLGDVEIIKTYTRKPTTDKGRSKSAEHRVAKKPIEPPFPAEKLEVHVITIGQGQKAANPRLIGKREEGIARVRIGRMDKPIMLLLSAYEPVHWKVTVQPGAKLAKIVATGMYDQSVTVEGPHRARIHSPGPYLRGIRTHLGYSDAADYLWKQKQFTEAITGKAPQSFQSARYPTHDFVIDGSTEKFRLPEPKVVGKNTSEAIELIPSRSFFRDSIAEDQPANEAIHGGIGSFTNWYASEGYSAGKAYLEAEIRTYGGSTMDAHADMGISRSRKTGSSSRNIWLMLSRNRIRYENEDTLGVALDYDAGQIYYHLNGVWQTGKPGSRQGIGFDKRFEYAPIFRATGNQAEKGTGWKANLRQESLKYPVPAGYIPYDTSPSSGQKSARVRKPKVRPKFFIRKGDDIIPNLPRSLDPGRSSRPYSKDRGMKKRFAGFDRAMNFSIPRESSTRSGDNTVSIEYSSTSKRIAIGRDSGYLSMFDSTTGQQLHDVKAHARRTDMLALNGTGDKIATSSRHSFTTRIWDVATGKLVREIDASWGPERFANSSPILFLANKEHIRLLNTQSKKVTNIDDREHVAGIITTIGVSADDRYVALGTALGKITIWEILSSDDIQQLRYVGTIGNYGAKNWIKALVFSPDNKKLYVVSRFGSFDAWRLADQEITTSYKTAVKDVTDAIILPDKRVAYLLGTGNAGGAGEGGLLESISLGTKERRVIGKFKSNHPVGFFVSDANAIFVTAGTRKQLYVLNQTR